MFWEIVMFNFNIAEETYRKTFYITAFFMFVFMLIISKDTGVNWDELGFTAYGERIANFYLSFGKDNSAILSDSKDYDNPIYYYGGLFELINWCLIKITGAKAYIVRHALTAFFSFFGVLFTGLLTKQLSDWKTAILSMIFIFTTPVFLGNALHNFKDLPFTASYIMGIYYIVILVKEIPNINWRTVLLTVLALGLAINIRVGGIILIPYLVVFFFIKILKITLLKKYFEEKIIKENNEFIIEEVIEIHKETNEKENSEVIDLAIVKFDLLKIIIICLGAYILGIVFWPYALLKPVTGAFIALKELSNVKYWNGLPLYNGQWFNSTSIPWTYIPKWILITTPLFIPLSLIGLVVSFTKKAFTRDKLFYLYLVLFTALFPIFYVIIKKSNLYDSWRHLYFVYPSLVVVSALGMEKFLSIYGKKVTIVLGILLVMSIVNPVLFMFRNYPNISFYFSPLVGGVKGAFKKYEIDYYGTSSRAAIEWIVKNPEINKPENKIRIKHYYGGATSIYPFIEANKNLEFILAADNTNLWDYSLIPFSQSKINRQLFDDWPPANTVHEIKVDNVPLVAIIKNPLSKDKKDQVVDPLAKLKNLPDDTIADTFINTSLELISKGDNLNAIIACERAIEKDPNNAIAYNNLCIAYNNLFMYDEAELACKKSLELNPQFQLAKNNYDFTLMRKNDKTAPKATAENYINLSFSYINIGKFEKSVDLSEKALKLTPNNPTIYNNLCVAYNGLKLWNKAIVAAEKAIKIAPDFQLAKNNLAWAKSQKAESEKKK